MALAHIFWCESCASLALSIFLFFFFSRPLPSSALSDDEAANSLSIEAEVSYKPLNVTAWIHTYIFI